MADTQSKATRLLPVLWCEMQLQTIRGCIRTYRESLALLVKQKESEKGGVNSLSARDVSTAEAAYSA